jgi:hypothetical protein
LWEATIVSVPFFVEKPASSFAQLAKPPAITAPVSFFSGESRKSLGLPEGGNERAIMIDSRACPKTL